LKCAQRAEILASEIENKIQESENDIGAVEKNASQVVSQIQKAIETINTDLKQARKLGEEARNTAESASVSLVQVEQLLHEIQRLISEAQNHINFVNENTQQYQVDVTTIIENLGERNYEETLSSLEQRIAAIRAQLNEFQENEKVFTTQIQTIIDEESGKFSLTGDEVFRYRRWLYEREEIDGREELDESNFEERMNLFFHVLGFGTIQFSDFEQMSDVEAKNFRGKAWKAYGAKSKLFHPDRRAELHDKSNNEQYEKYIKMLSIDWKTFDKYYYANRKPNVSASK